MTCEKISHRCIDLLNPSPVAPADKSKQSAAPRPTFASEDDVKFKMTEDEERELAELLDSD